MNIWQGQFPYKNSAEDGYVLTAPVNNLILLFLALI